MTSPVKVSPLSEVRPPAQLSRDRQRQCRWIPEAVEKRSVYLDEPVAAAGVERPMPTRAHRREAWYLVNLVRCVFLDPEKRYQRLALD